MMFGLTDKITAMVFAGLSAILLALCAVLYIEANGFFWIDGLKDKLEKCERDRNELRAELKRISTVKNEQVERTKETIRYVERIRKEADKVAEKIEQTPLPGNCKTPRAVLEADL